MRAAFILAVLGSPLVLLGCPTEVRDFNEGGGGSGGSTSSSSSSGSTSSSSSSSGSTSSSSGSSSSSSSSGAPLPTDLYVDPGAGDDAASGDADTPLRTLGKALSLIKSGYTIHILPGVLTGDSNGDTFNYTVPDGVHILGAGPGSTVLDGLNAPMGFKFAGGGSLTGCDLAGFGVGARVTSGSVTIDSVRVFIPPSGTGFVVDSSGYLLGNGITLEGGSTGVQLGTAAKLVMTASQIMNQGPNCAGGVAGISAMGSASVQFEGGMIAGVLGQAIDLRQAATAHLLNTTIEGSGPQGCGNGEAIGLGESAGITLNNTVVKTSAGPGLLSYGTGQIQLDNATFDGNGWSGVMSGDSQVWITGGQFSNNQGNGLRMNGYVMIDGATFKANTSAAISVEGGGQLTLRKSQLLSNYEGISASTDGVNENIDLGTSTQPGDNTLQNSTVGLYLGWTTQKTVPAYGNTWVAGQQGADANGHYQPGPICGPFGNSGNPRNFRIAQSGPCVAP